MRRVKEPRQDGGDKEKELKEKRGLRRGGGTEALPGWAEAPAGRRQARVESLGHPQGTKGSVLRLVGLTKRQAPHPNGSTDHPTALVGRVRHKTTIARAEGSIRQIGRIKKLSAN